MATDIPADDLLDGVRTGSEMLLDEAELRVVSELLLEHREIEFVR